MPQYVNVQKLNKKKELRISKSSTKTTDCRNWLPVHAIPVSPVCIQLEHLWPDQVLETSRRQWRFSWVWVWCLAHPDCRLYSHPISERIQEAARNDSHHHQCEEIFWCVCVCDGWRSGPPPHLSKRSVLNLLLSDIELSSCANLIQHVKTKLVTVARPFKRRSNHKHHWLGFTCASWETFWNLLLPKWDLWACFLRWWFRNGGLWWRFALAEKTSSLYSLWCGDTESGSACQQCGGVNPQSLCQTREEAAQHEKHLHDL